MHVRAPAHSRMLCEPALQYSLRIRWLIEN